MTRENLYLTLSYANSSSRAFAMPSKSRRRAAKENRNPANANCNADSNSTLAAPSSTVSDHSQTATNAPSDAPPNAPPNTSDPSSSIAHPSSPPVIPTGHQTPNLSRLSPDAAPFSAAAPTSVHVGATIVGDNANLPVNPLIPPPTSPVSVSFVANATTYTQPTVVPVAAAAAVSCDCCSPSVVVADAAAYAPTYVATEVPASSTGCQLCDLEASRVAAAASAASTAASTASAAASTAPSAASTASFASAASSSVTPLMSSTQPATSVDDVTPPSRDYG